MGMGMGFAMANQMAHSMQPGQPAATAPAPAAAPGPATPPPLPQQVTFFAGINGQQTGPFDTATLAGKVQSGEINRETLVWTAGMAAWQAAGTVQQLQGVFATVPPPLPPQP
jgi:hypothetical protein